VADDFTQIEFRREGAAAYISLNRPDKLNAITPTLVNECIAATEQVAADSDARVLVVSGNGGRAFSAGVDIKANTLDVQGSDALKQYSARARQLIGLWETMPQITIARIDGYCFTGGLELALGCDLLVCSDRSQFCDTHAKLGFKAGWGLARRLAQRIGVQRAKEMSYTARRVSAEEALRIGLVIDAVPAEALDARVASLIEQMAANSAGSLAAYKDLYYQGQNHLFEDGLNFEYNAKYVIADRDQRRKAVAAGLGSGKGNIDGR
jgi:enoyl-CoA hydratase